MGRGFYRSYSPEFKERAIKLCLHAIKLGWSVNRFCRWARMSKVTMMDWLSDDQYFDQYRRAMEAKAVDFPALHADVVKRVIEGKINPAAAGVALRSIEFRMMREIKRMYEPTKKIEHKHTVQTMSDSEIEARFEELQREQQARLTIDGQSRLVPPKVSDR